MLLASMTYGKQPNETPGFMSMLPPATDSMFADTLRMFSVFMSVRV